MCVRLASGSLCLVQYSHSLQSLPLCNTTQVVSSARRVWVVWASAESRGSGAWCERLTCIPCGVLLNPDRCRLHCQISIERNGMHPPVSAQRASSSQALQVTKPIDSPPDDQTEQVPPLDGYLERHRAVIPVSVVLVAVTVRLPALLSGLPDWNRFFWDSDEGAVINTALAMGTGDLNPHTFFQPSLVFYLLLGAYGALFLGLRLFTIVRTPDQFAILYFRDPTLFYVTGRLLIVLAGIASVALLYTVAKRNTGRPQAVLAALLLTLAPVTVAFSQIVKVDTPAMLLALAACLFIYETARHGTWRNYLLSGLLLGLAASAKYQAGFLATGLIAAWLCHARGGPTRIVQQGSRLIGAGCAILLGFLAGTPYALLDFPTFTQGLSGLASIESNIWIGSPDLAPWWLDYAVLLSQPTGLGPGMLLLVVLGVGAALARRSRFDLVSLAIVAPSYLFFSAPWFSNRNAQFLLPITPVLLLLAANGAVRLARRLPFSNLVLPLLTVLAIVPAGWAAAGATVQSARIPTTRAARLWVEAHVAPPATILIDRRHVPQLSFTPASLERRQGAEDATTVLVSKRAVLDLDAAQRSRLSGLKDTALTQEPAYNLLMLLEPTEQLLPSADRFYELGFPATCQREHPAYAIVSDRIEEAYRQARTTSPEGRAELQKRIQFYADLRGTGSLVASFVPDQEHSGPRVSVFRLSSCT